MNMIYGSYNGCQPFYVLSQFVLNVSHTAAINPTIKPLILTQALLSVKYAPK